MATRKAAKPDSKRTGSATKRRVRENPDERPQSERFIEMAKQIGAAEDEEGAERAFRKVAGSKKRD